jgi:hypothetical protein
VTFQPLTEPVDFILLAGKRSPGIAEFIGAGSPRRWDERKGYGRGGAFVVYRGNGLAHFAVQIRLYTDADWADWHAWAPIVHRPPVDLAAQRAAQGPTAIGAGIAGLGGSAQQGSSAGAGIAGTSGAAVGATRPPRQTPITPFGERPRALEIWHPILEDLGIRAVVVENVLQPVQTADGEWTHEIKFIEYRRPQLALARPDGAQTTPQPQTERERQMQELLDENATLREIAPESLL